MDNLLFALLGLAVGGGGVYLLVALPLTRKLESSEKKLKRAGRAADDHSSQEKALQAAEAKLKTLEASHQTQIQGYEQQIEALCQASAVSPTTNDEQNRLQELEQSHQSQIEQLRLSYENEKQSLIQSHQRQLEDLQNRQPEALIPSSEPQQKGSSQGLGLGMMAAGAAGIAGVAGLGAAVSGMFQKDEEDAAPVEESSPGEMAIADGFDIPESSESSFSEAEFEGSPFTEPELPALDEEIPSLDAFTEKDLGGSPFETPELPVLEDETPNLESFGEESFAMSELPALDEEIPSLDAFTEESFATPELPVLEDETPNLDSFGKESFAMPELPALDEEIPSLDAFTEEDLGGSPFETPELPVLEDETPNLESFGEESFAMPELPALDEEIPSLDSFTEEDLGGSPFETPELPVLEDETPNLESFGEESFAMPELPALDEEIPSLDAFTEESFAPPELPVLEDETPNLESFGEESFAMPELPALDEEIPSLDALAEEPIAETAEEVDNESPFETPVANWIDEEAVTEMPEIPPLDVPLGRWTEDVVAETPEIPVLEEEEDFNETWGTSVPGMPSVESLETLDIAESDNSNLDAPDLAAFGDVEGNWVDAPDLEAEIPEVFPFPENLEGGLDLSLQSPFSTEAFENEDIVTPPIADVEIENLASPEIAGASESAEVSGWQEPDFSPFGQPIATSEESSFDLSELELEGNWVDEEPVPALETLLSTSELENWLEPEVTPEPGIESSESTFDINDLDLAENWIAETPEAIAETTSPVDLDNWLESLEAPEVPENEKAAPIPEELPPADFSLDLTDDLLAEIPSQPGDLAEEAIVATEEPFDLPEDFLASIPSEHPQLESLQEELSTDADLDFLLNLQAEESDPTPGILSFSETTATDSESIPNFVEDDFPLLDLFSAEQDDFPELPISGAGDGNSEPFINFLESSSEKSDVEFLEMLQNEDQGISPSNLDEDDIFSDLFSSDAVVTDSSPSQTLQNPLSDKAPSDDHSTANHSFEQLFSEASSLDDWDLPSLEDNPSK